ncbi:MAG TPA: glycosyltransferase family 1 protein [Candidatus Blautia faecipullorum]|nr:glycosyltransferase family 1 protein [Candidatus Blautia faecipullorum]
MEKIRVLHLELDSHLGGIESFLRNLAAQTEGSPVESDYVTSVGNPALQEELQRLGGRIFRAAPHRRIIRYCRDINRLIQSGYDIIHIHKNSAANILPVLLAKKNRKAVIVHSHNTRPSVGGAARLLHFLNRGYLSRAADIRFACSQEAGRWMFGNDDFEIVHNGIITDRFLFDREKREQKRKELGIGEKTVVIGHIGRFTEQKNQEALVEIFRRLCQRRPDAVLLLAGDGKRKAVVQRRAEETGLGKKVIFAGVRADIPELLMGMDAFVMPSRYEGLPLSAVEAQASGLPVILSDTISGDTEITDGVSWFSFKEPPEAAAELIWEQVQKTTDKKRTERNQMVRGGGYHMEDTAKRILEIYQKVIREKTRPE